MEVLSRYNMLKQKLTVSRKQAMALSLNRPTQSPLLRVKVVRPLVLVARSLARRQVEAKRAPHAGDGLVPRGRQRHPDLGRQRGDAVAGACWPLVLAHVESRPHGQASAAQAADGLMRLAEARGSPEQHLASSGVGSSLLQWVAPVGCTSGLHQWVAPVGGAGRTSVGGISCICMHMHMHVCVCPHHRCSVQRGESLVLTDGDQVSLDA